ncbi:hypothetical protein Rsub_00176 [Raphidocelis subcapitata]|uniref:F-box domain-containing protein n=1 Tax=Raphidocelis subcapitata TaxID=307507 RepID=A0A2V0NRL3_9CHLO|nr:hypothetical protein Rsub_00176 [Raphidocelis subcapitata]|eukprot:GBF87465.1 hypothetical protein Rsub_00176 [Raphidocelis subcapitata]
MRIDFAFDLGGRAAACQGATSIPYDRRQEQQQRGTMQAAAASCRDSGAAASPHDVAPGAAWSMLPDAVLEIIGQSFCDARQLEGASRVCKGWRKGFASGMVGIELTVHRDSEQWRTRMERLGRLLPGLQRCKAHVGAGVDALPVAIDTLGQQLERMEHLELQLGEGCQIAADSSLEFSHLQRLRSLTLRGGKFTAAAARLLLGGLAVACPVLEELRVLPEALCGLGDEEMPLLVELAGLKRLEFQAYRLTGAGLLKLTALPQLEELSVSGLDCITGLDAPAFRLCPTLHHLALSGDFVPPPDVVARLREVEGLTMSFRSTDQVAGLLRTLSMHLTSSLVKLDMGVVRVMREEALEGITQLARLTDLRLAVTGNSDRPVTLRLEQLAPLSGLRVLHVGKQCAYFPDTRRMGEASVRIPVDAASAEALAAACGRLRSLRLCLGAGDVLAEGLARLSAFSQLESLSVHAEPFSGAAAAVPMSLAWLPPGLTRLELKHVDICDDAEGLLARPPLPALAALHLDVCRLRPAQLAALAAGVPRLASLRLAGVAGLGDEALASLAGLSELSELSVVGPHNRALTQRGLQALAPLLSLRRLEWQSDDLAAYGPILECFTRFTTLRSLALSCTRRTMVLAFGEDYEAAFRASCPYIDLDLRGA